MDSKMNSIHDSKERQVLTQDFCATMEVKDMNEIANHQTSGLRRTAFSSYFKCRITHSRKNYSVISLIIHQIVTFILITNVSGLSPVVVKSREVVEEGKAIRMYCDFSLDETKDEQLYSILWYWSPSSSLSSHNNYVNSQNSSKFDRLDLRMWPRTGLTRHEMPTKPVQFFRYLSIEPEHLKKKVWLNQLIGIFTVNVPGSTTDSVLIDRTSLAAEGTFTCEVSIKPTFETKTGSGQLKVGRKPRIKVPIVQMLDENGRVIKGRLRRYKEGETLNLNCTSVGGYPTPNITWFINGEKASSYGLQPHNYHQKPHFPMAKNQATHEKLFNHQSYSSLISIQMRSDLATTGNLRVKCVVSLLTLYHRSNEISVETVGLVQPKLKTSRHLKSTEYNHNADHMFNQNLHSYINDGANADKYSVSSMNSGISRYKFDVTCHVCITVVEILVLTMFNFL